MQMHHTKTAILSIFLKLEQNNCRTYCWPTRAKIQLLLKKIHHISITLFAIDKHLKDLNDNGYIVSYRQFGQREDGTYFNKPSNRQLTKKAILYLKRFGALISTWLYKHFFNRLDGHTPFKRKRDIPELTQTGNEIINRNSEFSTLRSILQKL